MFRTLLFLIALLFSSSIIYAQKAFSIIGTISPEVDLNGKTVHISFVNYSSQPEPKEDSVLIQNNSFRFEGEMKMQGVLTNLFIKGKDGQELYQFLLMPGENELIIHPALYNFKNGNKMGVFSNIEPKNPDAFIYARSSRIFQIFPQEVEWSKKQLLKEGKAEKDIDIQSLWQPIFKVSSLYQLPIVEQFPDRYVALYFLKYFAFSSLEKDPEKLDRLFRMLSPELRDSPEGKELGAKVETVLQMAKKDKSYDFTMADTSGKMVKLSDFRGKKVLLEFWASWCGPCIANLPFLRKYAEANPNIQILAISLDSNKADWLKGIKEHNFNFATHISELKRFDGEVSNLMFNINYIPRAILIDENGFIENANLKVRE